MLLNVLVAALVAAWAKLADEAIKVLNLAQVAQ